MSNEQDPSLDPDLDLICQFFAELPRQGPGSPEVTRKALSFINHLDEDSRIADLGCGSGAQTLVLAKHAPGQLTGVDLFPRFIDLLNKNAARASLEDRLSGMVGDIGNLSLEEGTLDLIWSEGAIYNVGFEHGLCDWRRFLKPGGYIAVSEVSWFTEERPEEIHAYWAREYPGIDTIPNKMAQMQSAGYVPVASFILPGSCWEENFYHPQKALWDPFLKEHAQHPAASEFIAGLKREAGLYEQYKAYYGYAFYIGKRLD